ncbi:MAG: 3-isopropylmalate dehydratase small subunit [Desulfobacteraceae bacterium]
MKLKGRVWKFEDHINTDLIVPARFLNRSEEAMLARSCFADIRPGFSEEVREGDMVVAGTNFGCGSSREHAPLALKAAGIRGVIASSFARIFYRNAFNIGLPVLECPDAAAAFSDGDVMLVDLDSGRITDPEGDIALWAEPIPPFMQDIIASGGLVEHTRKEMGENAPN